jgi:uncharacterized protein
MIVKNKSTITNSPAFMPMLDLFQQMRSAGLKLTIEQYEWLRTALAEGAVLNDWEDLRDLCRSLWVRPSLDYDGNVFDREFNRYRNRYQKLFEDLCAQHRPKILAPTTIVSKQNEILSPPPRNRSEPKVPVEDKKMLGSSTAPSQQKGVDAVKTGELTSEVDPEFIIEVPIRAEMLGKNAANFPRSLSRLPEFDLDATIDRIGREGIYCDEVYRPIPQKKVDFLLLVDDSNAMRPFAPAVKPFMDMVEQRKRAQTLTYYFDLYPTDYLFHQQRPLWGIPIEQILGNLEKQRTVAIIISEGGAASPIYRQERVKGISIFLGRLVPKVREVLWINPLPPQRWKDTTAETIATALAGRMVFLDPQNWRSLTSMKEFKLDVRWLASTTAHRDWDEED